jgi:hypothetical protein
MQWLIRNIEKVLPAAIILMSLAAAIIYGIKGDVRRTIYWLSAAAVNTSVTF